MAYFPNGTAGMCYEEQYCSRCIHDDPDKGCAVWMAHHLYSYELCNEKDSPGKVMLDMLIPQTEDGLGAEQCAMFYPSDAEEQRAQKRAAERRAREQRDRERYEAAMAEIRP